MSVKTIGNLPIMHIGDVEKATSKPRPTIYRESREGTFPKPIQLGKRRLAWLESDIRDWILIRLNAVNDAQSSTDLSAEGA